MTPRPILYSFRRCPYAMRARMALIAAGIACELREVKLSAKPAAMIAASPKGTVPVLVLPDDRVIDQSLAIMRWALGRADPGNWLAGDDGALIAANDGPFKQALDRTKYPQRFPAADPLVHRAEALAMLRDLDARLAGQDGQLCGPKPMLADIALFPFVRQFAEIDRGWFYAQPLPALRPWLASHLASPLFAAAMTRYPVWRPGDMPAIFPVEETVPDAAHPARSP